MKMKKKTATHLLVFLLLSLAFSTSAANSAAFIQGGQSFYRSTNGVQEEEVPVFLWGRRRPTRGAQPQSRSSKDASYVSSSLSMDTSSSSSDPSSVNLDDDELDDERKANLFQFLLRDLQVEGVPLLSIDAAAGNVQAGGIGVHAILQAALWTTMAELIQDEMENKVCLVLEDFALEDLRILVDDFTAFQTQNEHVDWKNTLPELERVSLSLIGKGKVGPAMILEVSNATETTTTPKAISDIDNNNDEMAYMASMKAFSSRLLDKTNIYPYQQQHGDNTAYRFCGFNDAAHVLSSFWNCICELTATSDDGIGSTVLVLPGLSNDESSNTDDKKAPLADRFAAMTRLMSRTLCLFGGDEKFKLAYFSPTYNRDKIPPSDELVHGHLPPRHWIQSILQQDDIRNDSGADGDADVDIDKLDSSLLEQTWDYQRRAPVAAVVIKRVSLLQDENENEDEDDDDASSKLNVDKLPNDKVAAYARNAMHLARQGKESLQTALESEMSIYEK